MTANVVSFRKPALEIGCTGCGATVDAACDCGVPYMPAGQRAAAAIIANPQMSDRSIAAELGIGKDTVRRAREVTGARAPVDEPRTGLDGKVRRLPTRRDNDNAEDAFAPATPMERKASFLIFSNEALLMAQYEGPIDGDVLRAAKATASAWCRLVQIMEQGS